MSWNPAGISKSCRFLVLAGKGKFLQELPHPAGFFFVRVEMDQYLFAFLFKNDMY